MAKILVVDDEPDVLRLLEIILNRAGFAVIKASSGQECLKLLSEQDPDVIILDNLMPGMSGVSVMKTMQSMPNSLTQPPVIFLSAKGGVQSMLEGLEAGAYKYLVKPTSREKLVEIVRAAVEFREKRRRPIDEEPDWI